MCYVSLTHMHVLSRILSPSLGTFRVRPSHTKSLLFSKKTPLPSKINTFPLPSCLTPPASSLLPLRLLPPPSSVLLLLETSHQQPVWALEGIFADVRNVWRPSAGDHGLPDGRDAARGGGVPAAMQCFGVFGERLSILDVFGGLFDAEWPA